MSRHPAAHGCKGNHKPRFRFSHRDFTWWNHDGSSWLVFECEVCGNERFMADWWFWGKAPGWRPEV